MRVVTELNGCWKHLLVCSGGCGHVVGGKYGGESSWSRITGDTEAVRAEAWLVAALDAGGDGRVTKIGANARKVGELADLASDLALRLAPRLVLIGVHVWVELWSRWARQRIPGGAVAAHGADPLQRAAHLNSEWDLIVTRALAFNRNACESLQCTTPPPLAAHPGAAEQVRLSRAVALQSCNRGGVDEYLAGIVSVRTARVSAYRKIKRGELHVDHHVVPWRCLTAIRSQRGCRDCRLARVNHARNQSLKRIAAHQQVNRAVGAVFGIAHHRLLDQLNPLAHGGEGCLCGSKGASCLPAVGNLSV